MSLAWQKGQKPFQISRWRDLQYKMLQLSQTYRNDPQRMLECHLLSHLSPEDVDLRSRHQNRGVPLSNLKYPDLPPQEGSAVHDRVLGAERERY